MVAANAGLRARRRCSSSASSGTSSTTASIPRAILAITFTRRAAGQLRERDPRPVHAARLHRARARDGGRLDLDDRRLLPARPALARRRRRPRPARSRCSTRRSCGPLRERRLGGRAGELLGPARNAARRRRCSASSTASATTPLRGLIGDLYDELRSAGQSAAVAAGPGRPDARRAPSSCRRSRPWTSCCSPSATAFTAAKRERRGLDYADLAIATRDLLRRAAGDRRAATPSACSA